VPLGRDRWLAEGGEFLGNVLRRLRAGRRVLGQQTRPRQSDYPLARMATGTMDPSGEAVTRRAMWWGDLGLVLALFTGSLCATPFFVHVVFPILR
jgi:hypothetical protein